MAKTLKTRPLDVRIFDVKDHKAKAAEIHHHEKGFCDLPEKDAKMVTERYQEMADGSYPVSRKESCYYEFVYTGHGVCGCVLCTEKFHRKKTNRKSRHLMKQELMKDSRHIQSILDEDGMDTDALAEIDPPVLNAKYIK